MKPDPYLLAIARELLRTARMIPNREDDGIIVLLDPHTYMRLEDHVTAAERKEPPDGRHPLREDVILGSTIQ